MTMTKAQILARIEEVRINKICEENRDRAPDYLFIEECRKELARLNECLAEIDNNNDYSLDESPLQK